MGKKKKSKQPAPEGLKTWAIAIGELGHLEIRDLPVDVLDELGARHGTFWAGVIDDPGQRAGLLRDLVAIVSAMTDVKLPAIATGADAMAAMEHLVVLVDAESTDSEA